MDKLYPYEDTSRYRRSTPAPRVHGDLADSLDLTISCLDEFKRRGGVTAKYPPDDDGLQMFIDVTRDYFTTLRECNTSGEDFKVVPDIESWCAFLGISRQTLMTYNRRGGAWSETIEYLKTCICSCKKSLADRGKIPPMVAIFDMINNHHYLNTSEFRISTQVEQSPMTITRTSEEIMAQYDRNLLEEYGLIESEDNNE